MGEKEEMGTDEKREGRRERGRGSKGEREGGAHRGVSPNCSPYSSQRVLVSIPVSSRG